MNTHVGQSLVEELRNDHEVDEPVSAHTFVGTLKEDENADVPAGVSRVVRQEKARSFRRHVLDSDVIVYDLLSSNFEEVDHVIKSLKGAEYERDKVLVLISSVMTWVNTTPKESKPTDEGEGPDAVKEGEEGEEQQPLDENGEPAPRRLFFRESDFQLRVPSPKFQALKTLETIALSSVKAQPRLRVYVLCAGILYGNGERVFYEHFSSAWQ